MDFSREEMEHLRTALKKVSFLEHLKMGDLDALISAMHKRDFAAGETLIRQGERGDAFFLIADGSVGVFKRVLGVFKQRIATRRRGEFVGEMALVEDAPRNASIIADGDGAAFTITRATFDRVLLANPPIAELIRQTVHNRHVQDRAAGFGN